MCIRDRWAVKQGVTTEDQVAIMGGSYGGYATLAGLTFTPDTFACGVDIVGPSNLNTLLSTVPPYWASFFEQLAKRMGDLRTEAGKAWLTERSPLTRADQIKKPLLIGQGANDPRVKQDERDVYKRQAGGHHLLLIGSPGCGKTLLASRLPGLLPEPDDTEAMESAAIASVSGRGLDPARWRQRPYRAPHHTASAVALVGGGAQPRPGEISLAHNGVLFMDELPEWSRAALAVLREPLESGTVTVSRAARTAEFPARFQLVAAMNPGPCGWAGDASGRCRCGPDVVRRYRSRLSGPLLDRIDLHLSLIHI